MNDHQLGKGVGGLLSDNLSWIVEGLNKSALELGNKGLQLDLRLVQEQSNERRGKI